MLLTVRRRLTALDVEGRLPLAGAFRATLVAGVHHAVLSMLLAEHRLLTSLDVKSRTCLALLVLLAAAHSRHGLGRRNAPGSPGG